jgi:hypothetical protein
MVHIRVKVKVKVKLNLSTYLINYNDVKAYGGVEL